MLLAPVGRVALAGGLGDVPDGRRAPPLEQRGHAIAQGFLLDDLRPMLLDVVAQAVGDEIVRGTTEPLRALSLAGEPFGEDRLSFCAILSACATLAC